MPQACHAEFVTLADIIRRYADAWKSLDSVASGDVAAALVDSAVGEAIYRCERIRQYLDE
jgi:hypothetical protein